MSKRDGGRGLIAFVDIADENYSPQENSGVSFEAAMGRIHALLPDGTVVKNVEVFRQIYETLGMGWVYAATKLPGISFIVDLFYGIWASWRLTLTGRPDLKTILKERQQQLECQTSRCDNKLKK